MNRFLYAVDDDFVIRIWDTTRIIDGNPPILIQPFNPNGSGWKSKDEAENWALDKIDKMNIRILQNATSGSKA